jgi:hypothetical protein
MFIILSSFIHCKAFISNPQSVNIPHGKFVKIYPPLALAVTISLNETYGSWYLSSNMFRGSGQIPTSMTLHEGQTVYDQATLLFVEAVITYL